MPERTAVVRRVAEVVGGRGDVAVVGPRCPWRDDLVELLAEQLPDVTVQAYDAVPDDGSATVGLELGEGEAALQRAERDWEASGARARGEPLVPGAGWVATRPDDGGDEPAGAVVPDVDVVFVPVSGVRPPRRIQLFWDWSDHVLWDDEYAYLGHLEDLLPISESLRARLLQWVAAVDASVDTRTSDVAADTQDARLAAALAAELGEEFVVET